eukprot:SAG31_NODE_37667_length_302_cov_1.004926_1_plen_55_part_10
MKKPYALVDWSAVPPAELTSRLITSKTPAIEAQLTVHGQRSNGRQGNGVVPPALT